MATESKEFDIVVIGAGPGGYTAAIRAGQLGMKAAVVEKEDSLGGVCLNWGCIPTKALLKQAEIYRLFQRAGEFGFEVGEVGFDWKKIIGRSRRVAGQLASGVAYLMSKNGVQVFTGRGVITPAKKVEVRDGEDQVCGAPGGPSHHHCHRRSAAQHSRSRDRRQPGPEQPGGHDHR